MKGLLLWFLSALSAAALPGPSDPHFTSRAQALPAVQVYSGGWEHFVGGGVAVMDCNHDGYPDMYVAGGSGPSRLFVNTTAHPGAPISFKLGQIPAISETTGAYPIDINGDGWVDLFVMRVGGNEILKGGPDCTFTDVTKAWGLDPGDKWTTSFSATWDKGQSWPTIAVGNYVDRKNPNGPFFACDVNYLIRPEGRKFGAKIPLKPGFCALSMLISDWRHNGERTLRIANDRQYYVKGGYEQMWHLSSPPREFTEAEGWPHVSLWGMGIASADLKGTGYPDIMTTSMGDQLLQINSGGALSPAPYSIGTYAQRPYKGDDGRPSTGWHAEFADVNNDGRADLFIAKGNVDQMMSNASKDPNNLLIQQPDGQFVEKADVAGVGTTARSRGAALVDLNGDGLLDLVVVNRRAPMELWQNDTPTANHWLEVQPRMDKGGNAYAIGAWVQVRTKAGMQDQEIDVGGGHASGHMTPIHFGLGSADAAEVRVVWPDGATSDWAMVAVDRKLSLRAAGKRLVVGPLY